MEEANEKIEEKSYGNRGSINFYAGADYGLDPNYGEDFLNLGYRIPAEQFGYPSDPTTADQLRAVSNKLSTGAKTIEVSGVNIMGGGPGALMEKIPEQHLGEIYRLKKLAGVDLTFHGPLVEPTGVSRQGWNESDREQAERQMWLAVKRAHKLDPKGNLVVTFHSSNGLPEPETKVFTEVVDPTTGKKKVIEKVTDFWVVDEAEGRFSPIPIQPQFFKSEEGKLYGDVKDQIKELKKIIEEQNRTAWFNKLYGVSYHATNGSEIIDRVIEGRELKGEIKEKLGKDKILQYYKEYLEGGPKPKLAEKLEGTPYKEDLDKQVHALVHGDTFLRDAYQNLQGMFNQAYQTLLNESLTGKNKEQAKKELAKLNSFREGIKPKLEEIEDPVKLAEFGAEIVRGVNILRSVEPPQTLKPLRDFAVEKSAETFANVALNSYKEFKNSAPIISIENPPNGMGLARADDLRDVVKTAREKLTQKLIEKANLSENEAKEQAEKLIGVTWDVGHINMIRKYGYGEKHVVEETKKIAEFVKHVHLSDNFGMEHTELPMGMGNVPVKPMLEAIENYNKQVKKIVETGDWFSRQGGLAQTNTPVRETLRAFGSPLYAIQMAPFWNQATNAVGGYFGGYGTTLPEQHFSMYGSGFSNLPPELGGQMAGRSRMGGAPMQ
ncbi:hypothetical protein HYV50_00470 [Candidatus Pacearchaeota archaeon]|nr:hypothetical protein [Candidatus Pacearchaeota archaeon]